MSDRDRYGIETAEQLRAVIGEPMPAIAMKVDAAVIMSYNRLYFELFCKKVCGKWCIEDAVGSEIDCISN